MSVYNLPRVKELANEQMRKDLIAHKHMKDGLTKQELNKFFTLFHIVEECISTEIFAYWKFYTHDDIYEYIINNVYELKQMCRDFDTEEILEEAKSMQEIYGFMQLSDDLYLIKEVRQYD